jgi:ribosomal protein S18 acetylase RimI-like enzyme
MRDVSWSFPVHDNGGIHRQRHDRYGPREAVEPVIRRYQDRDHDAVYDVCVRTADSGGDARGMYHSDDLMPDLFLGPYLFLEPEFCWVLDDGERAAGYVVGTPDTAAFAGAWRDRWIPRMSGRYQESPDPPVTPDGEMVSLLYAFPEAMLWPGLDEYPAHLHIDLLPHVQGSGRGTRLIGTFFEAVQAAGVPGVHLVVTRSNVRAIGFYHHLGFKQLPVIDPAPIVYLGIAF